MSAEYIISVPYMGADFTLATDERYRIKDVKLAGRWWPAAEVLSVQLLQGLQTTVNEMPENTDE